MSVLVKDMIVAASALGFSISRTTKKNVELEYEESGNCIYLYNPSDEDLTDSLVLNSTKLNFVGLDPEVFDKDYVSTLEGVRIDADKPYRKGSNMRHFPMMQGTNSHYALQVFVETEQGIDNLLNYIVDVYEGEYGFGKGSPAASFSQEHHATIASDAEVQALLEKAMAQAKKDAVQQMKISTAASSDEAVFGDKYFPITSQDMDILRSIKDTADIEETTKKMLVSSRIGQGLYRNNVLCVEASCRVTGIEDERFLIASHIKPWRDCDNQERLDTENGLMLSPHIDKLFDQGYISFTDEGALLVSPQINPMLLEQWHINPELVSPRPLSAKQTQYMAYHRAHIFKSE